MYRRYNSIRGLNFGDLIAGDYTNSYDETGIPLPWITFLDDFKIADRRIIFETGGGIFVVLLDMTTILIP